MKENTQKLALPLGITQRPDGRYMGRFTYQGERFTFYDKDMKKLMKKIPGIRDFLEDGSNICHFRQSPKSALNLKKNKQREW